MHIGRECNSWLSVCIYRKVHWKEGHQMMKRPMKCELKKVYTIHFFRVTDNRYTFHNNCSNYFSIWTNIEVHYSSEILRFASVDRLLTRLNE